MPACESTRPRALAFLAGRCATCVHTDEVMFPRDKPLKRLMYMTHRMAVRRGAGVAWRARVWHGGGPSTTNVFAGESTSIGHLPADGPRYFRKIVVGVPSFPAWQLSESPTTISLRALVRQKTRVTGQKNKTKKRDGHGGFGHLTRMRAPQSNDPQTKTASGQYEVGGFISEIQILKIKIPTAKPTDPAKSKKVSRFKLKKSR